MVHYKKQFNEKGIYGALSRTCDLLLLRKLGVHAIIRDHNETCFHKKVCIDWMLRYKHKFSTQNSVIWNKSGMIIILYSWNSCCWSEFSRNKSNILQWIFLPKWKKYSNLMYNLNGKRIWVYLKNTLTFKFKEVIYKGIHLIYPVD